ncbi:MAG: hypothetical protein QG578_1124 [Thermodesulfobacteriota bacterium]|nr:hypothetical protein [Thermodesulfobacteriota bacterium]
MNDQVRTNEELLKEIAFLKLKIQELEHSESECKRAEEALRESEKRFRELAELLPETVYETDIQGTLTFVNRNAFDRFGYTRKDLADGLNALEMVIPDERGRALENLQRSMRGESIESSEYTLLRRDGSSFPAMIYSTLIIRDGRPAGLRGLIVDITSQKRVEAELRESEKIYRSVIENIQDVFYRSDANGRLLIGSPSGAAMFGYDSIDEMIGLPLDQVWPDPKGRQQLLAQIKAKGGVRDFEAVLRKKDGTEFNASFTTHFYYDENGNFLGTEGIIKDITEQKLAEEELKASLSLLSASLESTADGILIVDRKGKIARWNQKFADMWKIPGEVLTSRDDEKAINHILMQLADPERFVEKVRELYQQPDQSSFDQIEFVDGRLFERFSQPQRIEANIVGRVWSFRDITGRKRAEEEKAKLEEQYRQAQKMEAIGQLAGGVAHDFNNMLNIILGYSQMALMKTDPSSQLSANLMEIMNAARRSADLVRQLLAFARKQTIAPKALDLNDTISGMLNMLRKLIGEDINLIWMPAANLWQVKMDPAQIDQILANLAVNARDSISGVGKITIETGNAQFDKEYCSQNTDFVPGQYVLLSVSDNGCGMDKETCEQIFEPFFTTKEVGKGTGMGLATVYGIVKQNSGFIKVQSEPGKGTTFRIYLPRREEEAGTAINEPCIHSGPLTGTETVLLVEDNEALLKMGKMMLEELGYGVLTAGTPDEAVKLVEQYAGDIHLVLTDVVMPGMNGRDLMNRLSLLRPGIKGLFMSGYTSNVIAHRGILDEGVYFIQKPFHMEVLASRIRDALLATDSSHVNSDPKVENKGR